MYIQVDMVDCMQTRFNLLINVYMTSNAPMAFLQLRLQQLLQSQDINLKMAISVKAQRHVMIFAHGGLQVCYTWPCSHLSHTDIETIKIK